MNITGVSANLSMIDTTSRIGIAMLSKTLDSNEAMGEGIVKMIDAAAMENSVNPAVGSNFDVRV